MGGLWKIKFDLTREYALVTKEILTKKKAKARVLENKTSLAREYDIVSKENRTKEILALGGRVLENKTSSGQGIRRRDQRKSH